MADDLFLVGNGAGFAADRTDAGGPVVDALVASGRPSAIFYEMLAERTLALAQIERRADPEGGYAPHMVEALRPILAKCVAAGIPVIGNFGSANPLGAAKRLFALAGELGIAGLRVGLVEGDDLRDRIGCMQLGRWEDEAPPDLAAAEVVSANAYLGAEPIAEALRLGAQVVVTGRVTDSALALGPLTHRFGWAADDWDRLAAGVLAGHLLECGAQATGGYFADPGWKDVPRLEDVGFPVAEVTAAGDVLVTKPPGTGGRVDPATVTEQLLYEIHDPARYLTPDVILDLTGVTLIRDGPDRVRVRGMRGHPRPDTLKVMVCVEGGWLGEGEISYAGPNALARARLAESVLRARLAAQGMPQSDMRIDLIGLVSVLDGDSGALSALAAAEPPDVRLRLAVRGLDRVMVERAAREVEALYCAGPAGGGGVRRRETRRVRTHSCLVPRELVRPRVRLLMGPDDV